VLALANPPAEGGRDIDVGRVAHTERRGYGLPHIVGIANGREIDEKDTAAEPSGERPGELEREARSSIGAIQSSCPSARSVTISSEENP
jgi:hypothetical protein